MPSIRSLYNPGTQDFESLQRLFVAREDVLRELVDAVKAGALQGSGPNVLLVGPRGAGKTHLMAMTRHAVHQDPDLRPRVVLVWLREEERGVSAYVDWLYRIVEAIARHREPGPEEEPNLDPKGASEAWLDLDAEDIPHEAERFLVRFAGGRRYVLLVENLGDLFSSTRGLDREGQARFRDFVQRQPIWTILATTQGLSEDLAESDAPFYGFFRTIVLDPVDLKQATELLRRLAVAEGDEAVQRLLDSPEGRRRVRALHLYAGGNPRLLSLLYRALSAHRDPDNEKAFSACLSELMDDVTSYYQERLSRLAPLQEKIVVILAEARVPITVKEIARRAFTTPQSISPQLAKMLDARILRRTPLGRESHYELAEPLMRLLFEAKENTGMPSRFFVDFLAEWHTKDELDQVTRRLLVEGDSGLPHDDWIVRIYQQALEMRALRELSPPKGESHPPLPDELMALLTQGDLMRAMSWLEEESTLATPEEELANTARGFVNAWIGTQEVVGQHAAAIASFIDEFLSRGLIRDVSTLCMIQAIHVATLLNVGETVKAEAVLHQGLTQARAAGDHQAELALLMLAGGSYYRRGEYARAAENLPDAARIFRENGAKEGEAHALLLLSDSQSHLGDHHAAVESCRRVVALMREAGDKVGEGHALLTLGRSLLDLKEFPVAVQAFEEALRVSGQVEESGMTGRILLDLGRTYLSLADSVKARACFEETISRSHGTDQPAECIAHFSLGILHQIERRHAPAVEHLETAKSILRAGGPAGVLALVMSSIADVHLTVGGFAHARGPLMELVECLTQVKHAPPETAATLGRGIVAAASNGDFALVGASAKALATLKDSEGIGLAGSALLTLLNPEGRPDAAVLSTTRSILEKELGALEAWTASWRLFDVGVRSILSDSPKKVLLELTLEERALVEGILAGQPADAGAEGSGP